MRRCLEGGDIDNRSLSIGSRYLPRRLEGLIRVRTNRVARPKRDDFSVCTHICWGWRRETQQPSVISPRVCPRILSSIDRPFSSTVVCRCRRYTQHPPLGGDRALMPSMLEVCLRMLRQADTADQLVQLGKTTRRADR